MDSAISSIAMVCSIHTTLTVLFSRSISLELHHAAKHGLAIVSSPYRDSVHCLCDGRVGGIEAQSLGHVQHEALARLLLQQAVGNTLLQLR